MTKKETWCSIGTIAKDKNGYAITFSSTQEAQDHYKEYGTTYWIDDQIYCKKSNHKLEIKCSDRDRYDRKIKLCECLINEDNVRI